MIKYKSHSAFGASLSVLHFLWHRMSTLPFRVRACHYLFIYVLIYEHFCLFIHLFTFPRFVGTVMLTAAKMRRTLPLGEMCSKLF